MAKVLSCRDVGVDCDFVARGESEDDVMNQIRDHAMLDHNMSSIPSDISDRARKAIHDEQMSRSS